jgi:hypothetical protein
LSNYYHLLELNTDATLEDIHKAFRRLAASCHPDKPYDTAELAQAARDRFTALNTAKEALITFSAYQKTSHPENSMSAISPNSRNIVLNKLQTLLQNGGTDFRSALLNTGLFNATSNLFLVGRDTRVLLPSFTACADAFEAAQKNQATDFDITTYPEVVDSLCIQYEAAQLDLPWVAKLSHLSMTKILWLAYALDEAKLPVKETLLAFSDINNDQAFELTAGINLLNKHNIANLDNVEALYRAGMHAQKLSNGLVGIHRIHRLTPENREKLLSAGEYSCPIGLCLETIQKVIQEYEISLEIRKIMPEYQFNGMIEYDFRKLFLSQAFIDRLCTNPKYAKGVALCIADLIKSQAEPETHENLISDAIVDNLFAHAPLVIFDSHVSFLEAGISYTIFLCRANHVLSYQHMQQAIEFGHLAATIRRCMENTMSMAKATDANVTAWNLLIARLTELVADEPDMQNATQFLKMLNETEVDGTTLAAKLSHIRMIYINKLVVGCLQAKLPVVEVLKQASVLSCENFMTVANELCKLITLASPAAIKSPQLREMAEGRAATTPNKQGFFTHHVDIHARFWELLANLRKKENIIEPYKDCSIM